MWGSWLGCAVVTAMGELFNLGAGGQKGKPLHTPGTHSLSSGRVVICMWLIKGV